MALDTNLVQLQTNPNWQPYTSTVSDFELPTGAGTKTVYARFRNSSGVISGVFSDSIEPAPLNASIVIADGDTTTPTRNVSLLCSAVGGHKLKIFDGVNPDTSGVDPDTTDWMDFADAPDSRELPLGVGMKSVTMQVWNDFLIEQTVSDSVEPAPLNASIVIADGDTTTPTKWVSLTIDATSQYEMKLLNGVDPSTTEWIDFQKTYNNWELSMGEGIKTVTLIVRNDFLLEQTVSDSIEPAPLNPSIVIANGDTTTLTRKVSLKLSADIGVESIALSNDVLTETPEWTDYLSTINDWMLSEGSGIKRVYLTAKNDFGIESSAYDSISPAVLGTPMLSILPDDSSFINHPLVTLSLSADNSLMMRLSDSIDTTSVDWVESSDSYPWTLSDGDGYKSVHAWFKNDFYTSEPTIDAISLDKQAIIDSFSWSSSSTDDTSRQMDILSFSVILKNDSIGAETEGNAIVNIGFPNWLPIIALVDNGNGSYYLSLPPLGWDRIGANDAEVSIIFTDRAGNKATIISPHLLNISEPGGWKTFVGNGDSVTSITFSPNDSVLASGLVDGHIWLWNTNTATPKQLDGHSGRINSLAYKPDGSKLASCGNDSIKVWRTSDCNLDYFIPLTGNPACIDYMPNGSMLASGDDDGNVILWRAIDGNVIRTFSVGYVQINSVVFIPDGSRLACGDENGTITFWDVNSGVQDPQRLENPNSVTSIAFNSDGSKLASGYSDGTILIWDVSSHLSISSVHGHTGGVGSVAFSPDDLTLASGGNDNLVKLWRVEDSTLLTKLEGHTYPVNSISFSLDGRLLASGSDDGTIKLWR
ncbi:MAG: WD40 repeat domain-containing protein [bacterium]